jgi:phage shock protein A
MVSACGMRLELRAAAPAASRVRITTCLSAGVQVQLDQQNKAVDQLLGNTREMESKLAEAKSKKETLKARAASAKSSKQVRHPDAPPSAPRRALPYKSP